MVYKKNCYCFEKFGMGLYRLLVEKEIGRNIKGCELSIVLLFLDY